MYWHPYFSHNFHHPSQTPCLLWISYATQKLIPYVSVAFSPSLKHKCIAHRSSKVSSHPDFIFEIHQQWQSGFSRVYSNSCCSSSFEPEIIKLVSYLIRCIAITYWIFKSLRQFRMPVQKMSINLLNALHIYIWWYRMIFFTPSVGKAWIFLVPVPMGK